MDVRGGALHLDRSRNLSTQDDGDPPVRSKERLLAGYVGQCSLRVDDLRIAMWSEFVPSRSLSPPARHWIPLPTARPV
jgi:hypothetical protein